MGNLLRRLDALQRVQDVQCATCWDEYINALLNCAPAFEWQGVPADVADRCFDDDLTYDEQALIDAAMPYVQAEIEAIEQAHARFAQIEGVCGPWLERETEKNRREIARHQVAAGANG